MPLSNRTTDPREQQSWVIANIVLGRDGSTTLNGRSKGLSSARDRTRFHQIRESADALLIGGNTSRIEPYSKTPKPLFVLSRQSSLSQEVAGNESAHLLNMNLSDAVIHIRAIGLSKILVEAGATLILAALHHRELDGIYLTRTPFTSGQNILDLSVLEEIFAQQEFVELERSEEEGEIFSFLARAK